VDALRVGLVHGRGLRLTGIVGGVGVGLRHEPRRLRAACHAQRSSVRFVQLPRAMNAKPLRTTACRAILFCLAVSTAGCWWHRREPRYDEHRHDDHHDHRY
jgi:hypothetical protein